MDLPEYAYAAGILVRILSVGHFPTSVMVKEIVSGKTYETDIAQLSFKEPS